MNRRLPALALILAAVVATVVVARDPADADVGQFSQSAAGWMPAAPATAGLTETWFCPGVPATGTDGVAGEIVVANRRSARLLGSALLMNERGENVRVDISVDPLSIGRILLPQQMSGTMVGALVEIEQGGGLVEQVSRHPAGDSVAPCANAVGDRWYLADGYTIEGSLDQVVLTNPFEQTVVVNLEFATREGPRQPGSYRGLTIPPRSVRVIDLGRPGAGAQSEPLLAVSVEATRGRLVVGRFQRFLGGDRSGAQVTVGQPAVREQWWFADVVKEPGVTEQYAIYNPTDSATTVDVVVLGGTFVDVDPIEIPAREIATFVPGEVEAMPDGRYALVLATLSEPSIVVERSRTRTSGDDVGTSVIPGATARQDGYIATTWHVPAAPNEPAPAGLVVFNVDNAPGTVTVSLTGVDGSTPLEGLVDVPIGPASQLVLDVPEAAAGRQLTVTSTNRILVERSIPSGVGALRTTTWALPAG